MNTPRQILDQTRRELAAAGIENGGNEAAWIVGHVTGLSRDRLVLEPRSELTVAQVRTIEDLTARRVCGEPLQYILGEVDFRGWLLSVGPGVLIPRPETERLVDLALEHWSGCGTACDMCTGSGAIAIALAAEKPPADPVMAVDISSCALNYARKNVRRHGVDVRLLQADLFSAFNPARQFELITANPPYVGPAEYDALPVDVRDYEPREALLADEAGRACLKRLVQGARRHLNPEGWLLSEIGEDQGEFCRELARAHDFTEIKIHRDLAGRDRILAARMPRV